MKKSFPEIYIYIYIGSFSIFLFYFLQTRIKLQNGSGTGNEAHRASFFVQLRVRDTRVFLRGCNRFRNCVRKRERSSFGYRKSGLWTIARLIYRTKWRHRCIEYSSFFFFIREGERERTIFLSLAKEKSLRLKMKISSLFFTSFFSKRRIEGARGQE